MLALEKSSKIHKKKLLFRSASLLLPAIVLATTPTAGHGCPHVKRDSPDFHQNYHMWAVDLVDPETRQPMTEEQAAKLAEERGFHHLGRVGELEGVHVFAALKESSTVPDEEEGGDAGGPRASGRSRIIKRSVQEAEADLFNTAHVNWFELQIPRKRHKRGFEEATPATAEPAPAAASGRQPAEQGAADGGKNTQDSQSTRSSDIFRNGGRGSRPGDMPFVDPLYKSQWHLRASVDKDGMDLNVLPVWRQGVNGTGVTVAVVDDGVDFTHPDLVDSKSEETSWDFNKQTKEQKPEKPEDRHGTRCAGEIAARPNDVCGVGVAYGARIAGERLISDWPTDSDEAAAFTWYMDKNDIYSSSWGPGDDGTAVEGPGLLTQRALAEGTARGRGGRGSIYVFAAGNGRAVEDNCNFDGYANSPYTISIGAITKEGVQAYYSEECSAILAVTFSSGQGHFISTTDVGNTCTKEHSGTSAAAPLAAGVVALMLQVRPELTWRDVQHLIVEKAVVTDISDASWETNGSGRRVSHRYGFGMMDAAALVEGARRHALVPRPQLVHHAEKKACNAEIPLADDELLRVRHAVDAAAVESLTYLESVQVAVWIAHPFRGRLRIELESPSGTRSVLATERATDNSTEGYSGWKFTTVLHWGEDPVGDWFLSVVDGGGGGPPRGPAGGRPKPGVLQAWKLTFFGTCSARDAETLANGSSTCGSRKAAGEASPGAAASGRILAYVLAASLVPFAAVLLCVGRRWSTLFRRRPRGIALGGRAGSEDIGLVDRALGFRDPRAKGFRPVRGSEWSLQIPKRTASLEEVVTPLEPDREEIYRTPRTPASLAPPAPAAAAAAAGPAAGRPQPLSQPRPPPAAAVANAAHAALASGGRHSFENPMIRSRSMTELRLLADGPESPARGPTVRKSGSTFFPLD